MLEMRKCREWVVNRSQNMGPNYGKFFGHLGQSVTAQKNQWLLVLKMCIKMYIDMEKAGNGPLDRFQNMGMKL